jgi:hypothetical protein
MHNSPAQRQNSPDAAFYASSMCNEDEDAENSEGSAHPSDNESDCEDPANCETDEREQYRKKTGLDRYLYEDSDLTLGEVLIDVCSIYKKFKFSKNCLSELIQLLYKCMPKPTVFPKSRHLFFKYLKKICPYVEDTDIKYYCADCMHCNELEPFQICPECQSTIIAVCIENDLEAILKNLYEIRGLASYLDGKKPNIDDGHIRDVTDAKCCIKVPKQSKYDLTLIENTDGFPVANSNGAQIWPNFLTIAELSPALRKKYLILSDVWYAPSKPDMNTYLKPFVSKMKKIGETGVTWTHPKTKEVITSRAFVVLSAVDAQARCVMQNIIMYNGKCGCSFCEIPGTVADQTPGSERGCQTYPYNGTNFKLRTHTGMVETANKLVTVLNTTVFRTEKERSDTIAMSINKGVRGFSCLSLLPNFDIAEGFSPEYMHSLLLGTVRRHLNQILDSSNRIQPFYMGLFEASLSKELTSITPPCYFNRLPRSLKYLKFWKASEFRNWLLFYSLPCLKKCGFPFAHLEHFALLVKASFIVLKSKISRQDIQEADCLLRRFCLDFETLYDKSGMTFNLHLLIHYPLSIIKCGPMWATSTFVFESANGELKESVKGNRNIAVEIKNTADIHNFLTNLQFLHEQSSQLSLKFEPLGRVIKSFEVPLEIVNCVNEIENFDNGANKYFLRGKVRGIIYTSETYSRATKTCSHFFQYSVNERRESGKLLYFCLNSCGESIFIAKKIDLLDPPFQCSVPRIKVTHIRPYLESNILVWGKMQMIKNPLLLIKDFLCIPPNMHEIFM